MKFLKAVLILSGLIIGAGMFAIPYSFAQAGFWLSITEFIILSGFVLFLHIIYSEIVLHTEQQHRLPGYIKTYLGNNAYCFTTFSSLFGVTGTLLIYSILGSSFITNILKIVGWESVSNLQPIIIISILSLLVGVITLFSLDKEALINGLLTFLLIGFIIFLIVRLLPNIQITNFTPSNFNNVFLLYGVLLFALNGVTAVPEVITILNKNKRLTRWAIILGSLIPALLYFLFSLSMVGNYGAATSQDAISGLSNLNNKSMLIIGNMVGLLSILTSFIVLSLNMQSLLVLDLKFNKKIAWLLVSFSTIFLYTIGLNDFIKIMSFVGTIFGGIDTLLLVGCFYKIKTQNGNKLSWWSYSWKIAVITLIIVGIIGSLV